MATRSRLPAHLKALHQHQRR